MDIVTQGVLGAAVGHAVLGRHIGRKAMAIGFIGGILPDLDVFLVENAQSLDYWHHHRGITHALVFGPTVGLPLAALSAAIDRWRSAQPTPFAHWYLFWLLILVTHPLLDLATHWGTAILMPFSDARFGVPALPVIDPLYTLMLVAALLAAVIRGARSSGARHLVLAALALSTVYIGVGWGQHLKAERLATSDLEARGIRTNAVHAYTTLFSPWLRRIVAVTPDAHLVGFVSTLRPQPIAWTRVPRDPDAEAHAIALDGTRAGQIYRTFATGPLHAELRSHDGNPEGGAELWLHDLRFGFPGQTLTGLWGMTAILDHEGTFVRAERFSIPRDIQDGVLMAMARAKLGLPQSVF